MKNTTKKIVIVGSLIALAVMVGLVINTIETLNRENAINAQFLQQDNAQCGNIPQVRIINVRFEINEIKQIRIDYSCLWISKSGDINQFSPISSATVNNNNVRIDWGTRETENNGEALVNYNWNIEQSYNITLTLCNGQTATTTATAP